jgi:hypothetical protein
VVRSALAIGLPSPPSLPAFALPPTPASVTTHPHPTPPTPGGEQEGVRGATASGGWSQCGGPVAESKTARQPGEQGGAHLYRIRKWECCGPVYVLFRPPTGNSPH